MKSNRFLLAAAFVLPILATAPVQAKDGLYIGLGAGVVFPEDSDVTGTGITDTSADFDTGYSIIGTIGNAYKNGLRGELELGYRNVDVDSVSGVTGGTGDVGIFSFMVNGLYDFKNKSKWTPYLGAGIGGANISADAVSPVGGSVLDDSDLVFAYQGIAGLTYQVNSNLGLYADYRYFGTVDSDYTLNNGTDVDSEYSDHRLMFGLRWNFGAPKPAPKPMMKKAEAKPMPKPQAPMPKAEPAPKPKPKPKLDIPQTFIVFFDWDKSNLTNEAQKIVNSAASFSKKGKIARIVATGHADRSGSDKYNMALSQRRAATVKAELIRLGILPTAIAIRWEGERSPLVNTKDGVREPQNRRVEIVLKK